ncbi:MAG TPA: phage holin family protein [Promineifilum sp.]|nr:phage holin family protein [Promineifilum sp.]HRQ12851.1 phage holin family protein [Promineifilum sp.]
MGKIRSAFRFLFRFATIWLVDAISLSLTAWFLPGIGLGAYAGLPAWLVALGAALLLGLVNLAIRPLILLAAMRQGFIILLVVGFFVNAVMLRLTAAVMGGGLTVDGWLPAIVGGIVLAIVNMIVAGLVGIDDQGSFYRAVIESQLAQGQGDTPPDTYRGVIVLQLDGLSYYHLQDALTRGYLPSIARMVEKDGYVVSRTDCGLSSQTSACQAGILYGDNYDIPAFRWYDKAENRLYVAGNDAALINERYGHGKGLLRDGVSINNLLDGDARLSLLTATDLSGGEDEERQARANDIYLLLLNPHFFLRVVGKFIGEAMLEVWQYTLDVVRGVEPRLNRLSGFYPLYRAATTVFMREVSGFLTLVQIGRGAPIIYTTWPGYDKVAHYSGPWSRHAFGTLRGFDRFVGQLRTIIAEKAPRPYELLILSDHGQSSGATFKMRYGYTLLEFIERYLPSDTVVSAAYDHDDGSTSVVAMAAELSNIQEQGMGGRIGKVMTEGMQELAEEATEELEEREDEDLKTAADVTFCASGNLAQVYFHAFPQRATMNELNHAYPNLIEALLRHEGVGLVVVDDDEGVPLALGPHGARNLHTGVVSGEDPLTLYGDAELRAWQTRRISDYPCAGDLTIISTVYPDNTVAAFEELIGVHGGLGGEQTDSFLLHPATMTVSPTRSSTDVFGILNARREPLM